jgi:AraC-like DNA-binding protein
VQKWSLERNLDMTLSIQKLWDICLLIFESYKIPITFINEYQDIEYEIPIVNGFSPFYYSKIKRFDRILLKELKFPAVITTEQSEFFLVVRLFTPGFTKGMLIFGPSLPVKLREDQVTGLINDYPLNGEKTCLLNFLHEIPVLNQDQLIGIGLLLYYMMYEVRLTRECIQIYKTFEEKPKAIFEKSEVALSKNRQTEQFHHDPDFDQKLFLTIERGNKEEFLKLINQLPENEPGMLSRSSYLRSKKNLAIAVFAIATRSAIKGGLHSEIAFTFSDLYIQRVEETFQPENVDELVKEGLLSFIDQVKKAREYRYSDSIAKCHNYIYKHLYKSISLKDLVHHVNLNPSYLSYLFKKEVGMTIRDYIQKIRIEEAMNLMAFTPHTLTEISNLLNFTDQSHFTKVFKKITGTTPKQFQLRKEL